MDPQKNLEALGPMTAEVDGANPSMEQRAEEAAEVERSAARDREAEEWAQIPWLIGRALSMVAPELGQVYTKPACLTWGTNAAAVAEKYGWSGATFGPELALAVSSVSFAVPSFFVIRERVRQAQEANEAGWFGKLVLWWKHRKAGKAGRPAPAAPEGQGDAGNE